MKQLWILAGGNGAGKSRFYEVYLKNKNLSFVNADLIAREISEVQSAEVSRAAQEQAMEACLQKISNGEAFCFETVFSHISKVELIKKAKVNGYEINLVFIHLDNPNRNVARVYQRFENGGHNVSVEKIKSRIPRALKNLKEAIPYADNVALIDNSSSQDPLKILVLIKNGEVIQKVLPLPKWVEEIITSI